MTLFEFFVYWYLFGVFFASVPLLFNRWGFSDKITFWDVISGLMFGLLGPIGAVAIIASWLIDDDGAKKIASALDKIVLISRKPKP